MGTQDLRALGTPVARRSGKFPAIQTLPFFLGFLLLTGLVVMTASLSLLAKPEQRARVPVAVATDPA